MKVGSKNRRTKEFHYLFGEFPEKIRETAKKQFKLFCENPYHKSLRLHPLENRHTGQHKNDSFSVSINGQYRAIFVVEEDTNIWYWVGTHSDYDNFTGR